MDGFQRFHRFAFLDKSDDGVDEHDASDDTCIDPMAEKRRDNCRTDQNVEQDIVELRQETPDWPTFLWWLEEIVA